MTPSTLYLQQLPEYFLWVSLFLGVVLLIGHGLNLRLFRALNQPYAYENLGIALALAAATGWLAVILALLVLGNLHALSPLWGFSAIALLAAFSLYTLRLYPGSGDHRSAVYWPSRADLRDNFPLVILLIGVFLAALKPPGIWDDTMYHLPYARFFAEQQEIATNPYIRYPFLPQNLHLIFALALAAKDEYFLQLLNAGFAAFSLLGIFGLTYWLTGGRIPAYLAVFGFLSVKMASKWIGYAYVDHGLSFFITASLAALALGRRAGNATPWTLLSGLYMGTAIGIKFFGLMAAIPVFLWLVATQRRFKPIALFSGMAMIGGGYWYLRSYWLSGNPFHPVGSGFFGYYLWSAEDLARQFAEQATHGLPKTLPNLLLAVAETKIRAYLLWPAFAAVWFWRELPKELRLFWWFTVAYYALWFYISQVDRYLMPALPTACVLAAWFLAQSYRKLRFPVSAENGIGRRIAGILIGLVALAWTSENAIAYYLRATKGFPDYLLRHGNHYRAMAVANDFRASYGDKLVQIGLERSIYFFKGLTIGDWFGPGRYSQWLISPDATQPPYALRPPVDIAAGLDRFGARLLAIDTTRMGFDPESMREYFDLLYQDDTSVLYGLKSPHGKPGE